MEEKLKMIKEKFCESNSEIDKLNQKLYEKSIELCLKCFKKFDLSDSNFKLRSEGVIEKEGIYFYVESKTIVFSPKYEYTVSLVEKKGIFRIFVDDFEIPTVVDFYGKHIGFQEKVKTMFEEAEIEYKLITNTWLKSKLEGKISTVDYLLEYVLKK
jgi:hypothetical protein